MTHKQGFFGKLLGGAPGPIILRLAIASIIVGAVLSFAMISPTMLWTNFFDFVGDAWTRFWRQGWSIVMWMGQYFILGAVIVVPLWVLFRIVRAMAPGGQPKDDDEA
ncbi:MAG: DUF6460 domain-containing protein [Pseudomonadota bacterium]